MQLAPPIQSFFEAYAPQDADVLAALFAPDAIVRDEGQTHHGPQAIRGWWLAAKAKYRHQAAPLSVVETGDKTVVKARVTGEFPGSPAVQTFAFGLQGGQISGLTIG